MAAGAAMADDEAEVTVSEAARRLGVSRATVHTRVHEGELEGRRRAHGLAIVERSLEALRARGVRLRDRAETATAPR